MNQIYKPLNKNVYVNYHKENDFLKIKFKCKKMTINKINIDVDEYYTYDDIKLKNPSYNENLI